MKLFKGVGSRRKNRKFNALSRKNNKIFKNFMSKNRSVV